MGIAAAAPRIGWTDLAYALAPTGRTLDYLPHNPYGERSGIPKYSYLQGLSPSACPASTRRRAPIRAPTSRAGRQLDAGPA